MDGMLMNPMVWRIVVYMKVGRQFNWHLKALEVGRCA